MKRQRYISIQGTSIYFVTTTVTKFTKIFYITPLVDILINNLKFYISKFQVQLHGFVIMPHHIHLLLTMTGKGTISQFMGQMKEYSAKQIVAWCQENGMYDMLRTFALSAKEHRPDHRYQVWQERFDDVGITTDYMFYTKLNYIHNNPLQDKWKLSVAPEMYPYSSAKFYMLGETALLPITVLI